MSDIKSHLKSFSVARRIESAEASGTLTLSNKDSIYQSDWTGDIAVDRKIQASAGYSSAGDPVTAVCLTGLVAGVDEREVAEDGSRNIDVKMLSPFKNYIKQRITTDWYEDQNGQQICESIVDDFMDWPDRDFTACAGTTFEKIRFEGRSPLEILRDVCEACGCDLIVKADGTIFAVAFPDFSAVADWSYAKGEISEVESSDATDITVVNTLNLKGKMFAPDEIREIKIFEETFRWYSEVSPYEYYNPYLHLEVVFTKTPAWGARFEATAVGYPETISFATLEVEEDRMVILCQRSGTTPYPDIYFTITCYGRPYQDEDLNQLQITVRNLTLLTLYSNVPMEEDYENKVVQTESALQILGEYKLKQNLYGMVPKTFKSSHNPSLELNDIISAETPTLNLKCLVRGIRVEYDLESSKLEDYLECWVIAAEKTITVYEPDGAGGLTPGEEVTVEVPAGIPEIDPGLPNTNRIYVVDNNGNYLETEDGKLIYIEGS